jgi:hypothetical protein
MSLHKTRRLGAGTTLCFRLKDLRVGLFQGFTDQQWAHMRECYECRRSYHEFLNMNRNIAREKLGWEPIKRKY